MLSRIYRSFCVALSGLLYAVKTQRNMKIHLLVFLSVVLISKWVNLSFIEWGLIIFAAGLVFITELINTSIEAVVDLETQEYNRLAKVAKDVAAASVLTASLVAVVIALLVIAPKFLLKLLGL